MNRTWAVLVIAAACGSAKTPTGKVVVAKAAPADAAVAAPVRNGPTMVGHPDTRSKIESPHGGPIAMVAETPDGTAAITSDELGGMRLWPALDGTREPCVVDLSPPRDLAIARHRDGFLVATIDAAQGLALTVLDDQGRTLRHATIAGDAGFIGMDMTDLGVLAWSDDQTIALYGFEGELLGRVGTEPGQRLANIAARGHFAVAEVDVVAGEGPPTRIVRPLLLQPKLAWDKAIDVGGDPMGAIAISGTGKRLAVAVGFLGDKKSQAIRVIEPQTGRTIATQYIDMSVEFGFSDDNHLAAAVGNGVTWIDLTKKAQLPTLGSMATPKSMFATGDGVALTAQGGELLVAKPDDPKYLGYQLESPQVATSGPNGNLVIGVGVEFAQIDSTLALVTAPTPSFPANSRVSELQWIGGDDYVANVANADGSTEVMIVASDGRAPVALRAAPSVTRSVRPLHYEPSTHLLTVSFGDSPTVDRWIPAQRRIEKIAAVSRGKGFQQRELLPISPALAGGAEIVEVSLDEKTTVAWTDATMKKQIATMPITSFVTADAAGHVYAWMVDAATAQLALSVLVPGKQIATLPHDGTVTLWPDPKGTRVLELGASGAALYRVDGTLVWKLPMVGASEAVWSGDSAIAIVTASGVARLDAATGVVTATRCGWRFGLTAESHPQPARLEPVCTQLRH